VPKVSVVGRVEPDRDHHRPSRGRRLGELSSLERSGDASIGDCLERVGVSGSFGGGACRVPAANLSMELLTVLAPDQVVDRPAFL
jgi:hypothetical protein